MSKYKVIGDIITLGAVEGPSRCFLRNVLNRFYVFCVLLTVHCQVANAQFFPVQVNPQLVPPYSLKLSDYASVANEKLLLNLLLTDVNETDLQVRLRFSVQGDRVNLRSTDFVQGAAPIHVTGGVPLRISNLDLRPYFDFQNLEGITPQQYSNPLPDGLYQFCFEVFDWVTGRPLSKKSCVPAYLVLNAPPFLNLPQRGELVTAKNPQNIIFQWTPRHLNATGVQYEFEFRELWDTQIDPQAAFLASPNLYQTTTMATTLLYGPGETPLLEGKTYGWRVRAIVSDGISEASVFKNKGYSEIFHFTYTGECNAPKFVLAKSQGTTREDISWQPDPNHRQYQVQYRKQGVNGAIWFEQETTENTKSLYFLEPSTTYEFRVGGQCIENKGYNFSQINTFTTPNREEASSYNCGIAPEIVITNQKLIEQLGVNDVFTAGDFPVTIQEIYGSNGTFSGWGFIVVPYLADTQIRVGFKNIRINTDLQLTSGVVETVYDLDFVKGGNEGVDDVQEELELLGDAVNAIEDLLDNWTGTDAEIEHLEEEKDVIDGLLTVAIMDPSASENTKADLQQAKENLRDNVNNLINEGNSPTTANEEAVINAVQNAKKELKEAELGNGVLNDSKNTVITGDGYFDGVIKFSIADKLVAEKPFDSPALIRLDEVKPESDQTDYVNITERSLGENKQLIVSASNTVDLDSDASIRKVKKRLEDVGDDKYLLWIHYDFKNNEVKYKVAFGAGYFPDKTIQRDKLVALYNDVLTFDLKGAIGSSILAITESLDVLLEEYNERLPSLNKELVQGFTIYDILKIALNFGQKCGGDFQKQTTGIVPKCLWDQDFKPEVAYYAGFIDGAWETISIAGDIIRFKEAWDPLSPFFSDPEAAKIRQQTVEIITLIQQLDESDELVSTAAKIFQQEFYKYIDTTLALTPLARYNQGKLIFEVASLFFGIGELNAFLKTGKVTSKMLVALQRSGHGFIKFVRGAGKGCRVAITRISDDVSKLLINGEEIATIAEQRIVLAKNVFLENVDAHLKPIGQLVTPKGYAINFNNGQSVSEKAFNIVEDAQGKYRVSIAKLDEVVQTVKKVIYPTAKINDVTVVRILEGANGKIALIGRKMSYIEEVEKALIKLGKEVEIFDIKKAFGGKGYNDWNAIRDDWDNFVDKFGVLENNKKGLPYDKVIRTLWYQENMRWAKWLKEQGFEIYDLGDNPGLLKNSPDRSAFYDLEKTIIFND